MSSAHLDPEVQKVYSNMVEQTVRGIAMFDEHMRPDEGALWPQNITILLFHLEHVRIHLLLLLFEPLDLGVPGTFLISDAVRSCDNQLLLCTHFYKHWYGVHMDFV